MNHLLFFILILFSNFLFSQDNSIPILNREEDFFKRIFTKYDNLLNEWGKPDKKDFNSYDNSTIATYKEKNTFGAYTFLSIENIIFKILYVKQCNTDNETEKLYDKYSQTFEQKGFNSERLSSDGFNIKAMKYSKNGINIEHLLFPMPKEGIYPNKKVFTIQTTITK